MNDTAIESAEDLVKQFRDQADQLRARARTFLWIVIGVVVLGVLLVILLPGGTAVIDRKLFGLSPSEVVKNLEDNIASRTGKLDENDQQRVEMAESLNQILRSPSVRWARLEDASVLGRLYAITSTPDGGMIAAGREGGAGRFAKPLLMRSDSSGGDWTLIPPTDDGISLNGRLSAITPMRDGGFIAVGKEAASETSKADTLLVVRSDSSGGGWTPIRPKVDDRPVEGTLFAIKQADGGRFIAAGWKKIGEDEDEVLFLRSDLKGADWTPIFPTGENGRPLDGRLYAITTAPDGGFIAVGRERFSKGDKIVIMRGDSSGDNWKRIRLAGPNGKPMEGRLYAITPALDGGFIAVGIEGRFDNAKPLIMRSDQSGDDWTPIRPEKPDGKPLEGVLYAIAPSADGGFIAAGNEDGTVLFLRSGPRGDDWTPIRPTEPDGTQVQGSLRAIAPASDDSFIAVGNEGSSRGGIKLMIHSLAGDEAEIFQDKRVFKARPDQTTNGDKEQLDQAVSEKEQSEKEAKEQSDKILSEYENIIGELENEGLLLPLEARKQLPRAKEMENDWKRDFNERTSLKESHEAILDALNASEPFQRISRIATRVAVVVLLIYLVQIMVNLYRYNTRLAAFYQARADAIELLAVSNISLGTSLNATMADIAAALSPDNVDFGKTPTPPSQQVVDMLGNAAKSVRSGTST